MADKKVGSRANMNQVEINAQWEEAVKKESRGRILNENFDFNPKHLIVVSDKVTSQNKLNQKEENKGDSEQMATLAKKLEVLTSVPKKKYPYPMTSSQEIGWDNDKLFNAHRPKYTFNRMQ